MLLRLNWLKIKMAPKGGCVYRSHFKPEFPFVKGDLRMLQSRVFGVWDYRPPWPYSGITDFTEYENVRFLEGGGMELFVEKSKGGRYRGARMQTTKQSGPKAWDNFYMEADMELPVDPFVVGAFWLLTKTHAQPKPIWSEKFKKWEKEKITPEIDWPETSTENLAREGGGKFNVALHYGLTHYAPNKKQKNAQFSSVEGRHTWSIEKRKNMVLFGLDGVLQYVFLGRLGSEPMYPILWLTVPSWAPYGYDPKGVSMKVYSFKVYRNET